MPAAIWDGLWGAPAREAPPQARQLVLWEHCRNSLGIARLLVREGRPPALVHTACLVAVEMACRAALSVGGEGPAVADAQAVLPTDLRIQDGMVAGAEPLAAAERAVGWVADYLRSAAPERSWGF